MREQQSPNRQEQSLPRFGNYDLERRIDIGGMGEVYFAYQRSAFGRAVAIKIIRSDLVHDITARARFLREAEVSAHLKHEHILPLFEFGEDQGRLFLVTPYIEGGTLARRLKSGPLPLPEVRQLFIPLVQAVAYIHRRGVVHRDLKPTNVLLDEEDGQVYVRLIDFGIASIQGSIASPELTTAGSEVGTIAYMAPERLSGVVAPSSDIFSLGVILYQMLTGQFPAGQQPLNLPQPLEYVVRRCIADRPEDRFATAEEVLKNFERAYQFLTTSSQQLTSAPPESLDAPSSSHISTALSRPLNTPYATAGGTSLQELVFLQNSGTIPVVDDPPQPRSTFAREDYNAPTTWFDPANQQVQQSGRPAPRNMPTTGKRRGLLPLLSAITIILLLATIGIGYYAFQVVTATSVIVNFSPQTQGISQVYTLTVDPSVQNVSVNTGTGTGSIPAKTLSKSTAGTQTGPTTGHQFDFTCACFRHSVSADDVDTLTAELKQILISQITQGLQGQMQAASTQQLSPIIFSDLSASANPPVGTISKTVTVSLQEQGSAIYMLNTDAQSVARQLVTQQAQQLWRNYTLLTPSISIGLPVIEQISDTSVGTIEIAAGCIVEYQFPPSELQALPGRLKSKTLADADNYLARQPGIDPKTVGIHFTNVKGNTLPGDPQQIKIVPINPDSLPPVQLTSIPIPTITPPADLTPGDTPSPTPTQTGDNN